MRDMLKFYGHDLTEDMVFGLGAGLGFLYYRNPKMRPPAYVGGRVYNLEDNLCRNLGFEANVVSGFGPREGWEEVRRMLDSGTPVMVHADVHYLDYLRAKVHFSGHRIVLVGYDDNAGVAFVADNDRDTVQRCSLEGLAKARSSTWFPQPADNALYHFRVPERLVPLEEAIPPAVRDVVRYNLTLAPEWSCIVEDGVTAAYGMTGLRLFATEVPGWSDTMEDDVLTLTCKNVYVTAEKGGTGYGGNFRRMYGRFLEEAAGVLGEERLESIGGEFISIGDRWTDLCLTFKELSGDGAAAVREATVIVREVCEREGNALAELEAVSKTLAGGP
jgi:hypothetical protein